jgi:hypothetical protein
LRYGWGLVIGGSREGKLHDAATIPRDDNFR